MMADPAKKPEPRFCIGGPVMDIPGAGARQDTGLNGHTVPLAKLVSRLDATMGQTALLLSERMRVVEHKLATCSSAPSDAQCTELCVIADGVAAAAYHVRKWAVLQEPHRSKRPPKPSPCENVEEAFATMKSVVPRLMVSATDAQRVLLAIVGPEEDTASKRLEDLGVAVEDIRALSPHLEILVARLTRFGSKIGKAPGVHVFTVTHFSPTMGEKAALNIASFLQD